MSRKTLLFCISLLLMFLYQSCTQNLSSAKQLTAGEGILDLSKWDLQEKSTHLSGDWKFYWNRLLKPEDLAFEKTEPVYMKIPGLWNNRVIQGKALPSTGYGTLVLDIILNGTNDELGIKIYQIGTAYKLWIDGELLIQCGIVGTNEQSMKGMIKPRTAYFKPLKKKMKAVLQISNYKDRHGGVWADILIGSGKNIRIQNYIDTSLGLIVFGIFFIIGLYYILLFLFSRKDSSLLYFGLCSFLTGIETFFYGEVFLMTIFPDFDFELNFKIQYLIMCLATAFFVKFLNTLFPEEIHKLAVRISWLFITLYCILIAFTNLYVYSNYLICFHIYLLLIILYLTWALTRAVIAKKNEAPIALAGVIVLFLSAINDILYSSVVIQTAYLVPYGLVFFALSYITILSIRFSRLNRAAFELIQIKNKDEKSINNECERHALSRREREVLLQLIKGMSYEDISNQLFISVSTLQKHIHSIYRKFGVKNRLELNYLIKTGHEYNKPQDDSAEK